MPNLMCKSFCTWETHLYFNKFPKLLTEWHLVLGNNHLTVKLKVVSFGLSKVMDSLLCCVCVHGVCLVSSLCCEYSTHLYLFYGSLVAAMMWTYGSQLVAEMLYNLQEYDYISSKRLASFHSSKPKPHQFTVLVRSIPPSPGKSYSDVIESFFTEYYPSTYLSHCVVRRKNKLKGLIVRF